MILFDINSDSGDVRWTCRSRASSFRSMRRATTRCPPCVSLYVSLPHQGSCTTAVLHIAVWSVLLNCSRGYSPQVYGQGSTVAQIMSGTSPPAAAQPLLMAVEACSSACSSFTFFASSPVCGHVYTLLPRTGKCSLVQVVRGLVEQCHRRPNTWRMQRKLCTMCMRMPVRSLEFIPNTAM